MKADAMDASPLIGAAPYGGEGIEHVGRADPTNQSVEIITCTTRSGLSSIKRPGTELVIWEREPSRAFRQWLDQIDASRLPSLRMLVSPDELRTAIEPIFDDCGLAACAMRDLLVQDVEELVYAFAEITGCERVDVRLEAVSHDACWRFHRDAVEARLLTTYRGPSTEWVHMPYADRALSEQKQFDGPLERMSTHHVAFFKGSSSESGSGVVHRSPAVAGSGCTRLLLCLNEQSLVSPDPWQPA